MDSFLNWCTLQRLLIALHNLIAVQQLHLRRTQHEAIKRYGNLLHLKTPVLHGILLGERIDHLLDLGDLLLG